MILIFPYIQKKTPHTAMLNLFIQLENAEKIVIKVPNITERLIQYQKIKQAVRHQGLSFQLSFRLYFHISRRGWDQA